MLLPYCWWFWVIWVVCLTHYDRAAIIMTARSIVWYVRKETSVSRKVPSKSPKSRPQKKKHKKMTPAEREHAAHISQVAKRAAEARWAGIKPADRSQIMSEIAAQRWKGVSKRIIRATMSAVSSSISAEAAEARARAAWKTRRANAKARAG